MTRIPLHERIRAALASDETMPADLAIRARIAEICERAASLAEAHPSAISVLDLKRAAPGAMTAVEREVVDRRLAAAGVPSHRD